MALMTQVARSAACNRVHSVEQRASRWLLQTHDRVEGDRFTLRREFLAQMLAEDHGAVDVATGALHRRPARSRTTASRSTVRDRAGLERASCDCYRVVREEYERLFSG